MPRDHPDCARRKLSVARKLCAALRPNRQVPWCFLIFLGETTVNVERGRGALVERLTASSVIYMHASRVRSYTWVFQRIVIVSPLLMWLDDHFNDDLVELLLRPVYRRRAGQRATRSVTIGKLVNVEHLSVAYSRLQTTKNNFQNPSFRSGQPKTPNLHSFIMLARWPVPCFVFLLFFFCLTTLLQTPTSFQRATFVTCRVIIVHELSILFCVDELLHAARRKWREMSAQHRLISGQPSADGGQ